MKITRRHSFVVLLVATVGALFVPGGPSVTAQVPIVNTVIDIGFSDVADESKEER